MAARMRFPRCSWLALRHARPPPIRMHSGRSSRAVTSSTGPNGRVETIGSLAEIEVADVFLIQPRTRKVESQEDALAALEEAVSLVRAIPGWDVVGKETLSARESRAIFGSGQLSAVAESLETLRQTRLLSLAAERSAGRDGAGEGGSRKSKAGHSAVNSAAASRRLLVFVNHPALTHSQQRIMQEGLRAPVFDRFLLILQIFRSRARSREAQLQIEMASLGFLRSRLANAQADHSQQRGGTMMRSGGGEKATALQLRSSRASEARAARELAALGDSRTRSRVAGDTRAYDAGRLMPIVALVGYTNAGKSSLHARLTRTAGEERADPRLFGSLDTASRIGRLADGTRVLFVDTIGFIDKLAHGLVRCFHATLQEALHCDLIVHVIDASSPHAARQRASVLRTLCSLPSLDAATVYAAVEAHNKADKLTPEQRSEWVARHTEAAAGARSAVPALEGECAGRAGDAPGAGATRDGAEGVYEGPWPDADGSGGAVLISAQEGDGCDELLQLITRRLRAASPRRRYVLRIGSASTVDARAEHTASGPGQRLGFVPDPDVGPHSSRSGDGVASAQLAFLHSHPLVTLHGTRAADDGATLLADVEMDELTYRTFVGRWGRSVVSDV